MLERVTVEPDHYEPYLLSQAIRVGGLLFVSGQAGYGDDGTIVPGGFRAQADRAFANLARVLAAGGADLASVVKVTIFVTDMSHFQEVVELRRTFFTPPYPADTLVEISALYDPGALFEIDAVAAVGGA